MPRYCLVGDDRVGFPPEFGGFETEDGAESLVLVGAIAGDPTNWPDVTGRALEEEGGRAGRLADDVADDTRVVGRDQAVVGTDGDRVTAEVDDRRQWFAIEGVEAEHVDRRIEDAIRVAADDHDVVAGALETAVDGDRGNAFSGRDAGRLHRVDGGPGGTGSATPQVFLIAREHLGAAQTHDWLLPPAGAEWVCE